MRAAAPKPLAPRRAVIGVTLGDLNGIGPEVTLKAVLSSRWPASVRFVLIGPEDLFLEQAHALGLEKAYRAARADGPGGARVACLETDRPARLAWTPGRATAPAARAAAAAIEAGAHACLAGRLDALVTAPICKEGLQRAKIDFPGHTEMLAALCGVRRFAMLLAGGGLRVVLATRHVPLRAVADTLTPKGLEDTIRLTAEALPWLGFPDGMIGVCGLNPHAGDGGALGDEERRWIAPTLRRLRRRGLCVEGPVPADTIFYRALRGDYAAVVALYHDQGLGPLKMLGFEKGINVTLGLPIARTSPDHGTAYDIAGTNRANPSSMVEAIRLAIRLASRPNPWRTIKAGA